MRFIFIFIFISMMLLPAVAFSNASATETGSIFGVVTDKKTGDPIAYANIVVEATALDAFSKDDGSYVIMGIPAGEYTVRAMMFGHTTLRRYRIAVAAGSSVEVNFALENHGG